MEHVALFGTIDIDMECTGQGVIRLSTDLPGDVMTLREQKLTNATGRRVVRFRLAGTTKGRLYILTILPATGVMRVYGARIWARVLPNPSWEWYTVPMPGVGEWRAVKLPIPEIGEWQAAKLPIPEIGQWQSAKLPIPETGEWQGAKLPIKETPDNPTWVQIEVDQ